MTIKEDMQNRLASILGGMLADGGGNRDKPYLSVLQVRTISSTIIENFFIIDRDELAVPQIAENTGRAQRLLRMSSFADEGPNVQGSDEWDIAVDKLVSAIHDVEALELAVEWKVKHEAELEELRGIAAKLFALSNPTSEWNGTSSAVRDKWIAIARNAKTLLT
jgi:hypothetical protein